MNTHKLTLLTEKSFVILYLLSSYRKIPDFQRFSTLRMPLEGQRREESLMTSFHSSLGRLSILMQISLSAKIAVEISWLIIVFNYTANVLLFSRFYSRDSERNYQIVGGLFLDTALCWVIISWQFFAFFAFWHSNTWRQFIILL